MNKHQPYTLNENSDEIDIYQILIDKWQKKNITKIKEATAIMITPQRPIEFLNIRNANSKKLNDNLFQFNSRYIINEALKKNAKEIVLAENATGEKIDDVELIEKKVNQFRKQAEQHNLELKDYLIIYPFGFYSYKNNQ